MEQRSLKSRTEMPEATKWHLEDIFSDNDQWEKEFAHVEKLLDEGKNLRGI